MERVTVTVWDKWNRELLSIETPFPHFTATRNTARTIAKTGAPQPQQGQHVTVSVPLIGASWRFTPSDLR